MRNTFVVLAMALMLCCCNGGSNAPTPRPRGFARVEAYSDSTVATALGDVRFDVNAGARIVEPREGWMNVVFDRYNATIYLTANTFTTREELGEAVRNRSERTSLDLGGRSHEVVDFSNDHDFSIRLTRALEPAPTPLQFMAIDGTSFVSGTVALGGNFEPADSLSPIVSDLERQLDILLNSLHRQ